MNATIHRHRVKISREPRGFDGCVAPHRCNSASHGGVRIREECSCGAYRYRNSTGAGREEVGSWTNDLETETVTDEQFDGLCRRR